MEKNVNKNLKDGIFNYSRKNFAEARIFFFEVLEKDPTNPEANYYLGLIFAKDNNYQKAVIHLKSVVDTGLSFIFTQQCRMLLGYIYFKNKEYRRAELEFLEVLNSKMESVQVFAALAAIYYQLEDRQKSLKFAEKAYSMDQFNLNAKNTYGYLLCDFEIDIPKGLDIIREVVRVKPDNPAYLDSLGWAYYKKGDVKAAIVSIKRGLDINKHDPELLEHFNIVTGRKAK
ncbi:MAG: hypothetical protein A2086_11255 [Spirochaetes bacterium GWD1_27_9]|nr:MAG: hypothetical protein A2086_11255 [Spirochaetes bacterium GWD1_27_9]